jgi:hypothetical protein
MLQCFTYRALCASWRCGCDSCSGEGCAQDSGERGNQCEKFNLLGSGFEIAKFHFYSLKSSLDFECVIFGSWCVMLHHVAARGAACMLISWGWMGGFWCNFFVCLMAVMYSKWRVFRRYLWDIAYNAPIVIVIVWWGPRFDIEVLLVREGRWNGI